MTITALISTAGASVREHTTAYFTDFAYDAVEWSRYEKTKRPIHWLWFVRDHGTNLVEMQPDDGGWLDICRTIISSFGDGIKVVYAVASYGDNDYSIWPIEDYTNMMKEDN